jgi:hypothetical protein
LAAQAALGYHHPRAPLCGKLAGGAREAPRPIVLVSAFWGAADELTTFTFPF